MNTARFKLTQFSIFTAFVSVLSISTLVQVTPAVNPVDINLGDFNYAA